MLITAKVFLNYSLQELAKVSDQTNQAKAALRQFNSIFSEDFTVSEVMVNDSILHANDLANQADMLEKYVSQRAHDVIMTSYQRRCDVIRCDVMTSHRRRSDVIMTSCACWDTSNLCLCLGYRWTT